jgi:cobalt-zinc-cadmium efflux system membrane fusion protein
MKSIILSLLIVCSSSSLHAQSLNSIQLNSDVVERLGLKSAPLKNQIISDPVTATAILTIDPTKTHSVASLFSGQITSTKTVLGQSVTKNDKLLTLKSREVSEIISDYIKASSKLNITTLVFEREKSLREKNLTTADSYLSAKTNFEEAAASYAAASQATLMAKSRKQINELVQGNAEDSSILEINSPISGVIIENNVTNGAAVEENQLLYKIADLSNLLVEIKVPLQAVDKIKLGDTFEFKTVIGKGKSGSAKVIKISPQIDPKSLTLRMFATLENSKKEWIAGTPVSLGIIDSAEKPRLSVPSSAVVSIGGKDCVFIDAGGGNYQPQEISIGLKSQNFIEITSDLKSGVNIVEKGASLLLAAWEERVSE